MCESRFPLKSERGGGGAAALHYLASTLCILAPSQGLMFYCHAAFTAALLAPLRGVQRGMKKGAARPVTSALFGMDFSLLGPAVSPHPAD